MSETPDTVQMVYKKCPTCGAVRKVPADQVSFREALNEIRDNLAAQQVPPDPEIERVWSENVDRLYES